MAKIKRKDYRFNDKAVNKGLLGLFLVGCLMIGLVGSYTLFITYTRSSETIESEQMQIKSNCSIEPSDNVLVAEDCATATVVE